MEVLTFLNRIPWWIKLVIICFTFPMGLMIFLIIFFVEPYLGTEKRVEIVLRNPTEETVKDLTAYVERNFLGFRNHPSEWNRIRRLWDEVNVNPNITTDTKEELIVQLMRRGLRVSGSVIYDNYCGNKTGIGQGNQGQNTK